MTSGRSLAGFAGSHPPSRRSISCQHEARVQGTEDAFKVLINTKTWLTYNGVTLVEQFAGRTVAIDVAPQGEAAG
jgi:hypothetical protein